jgi:hypothetical protein
MSHERVFLVQALRANGRFGAGLPCRGCCTIYLDLSGGLYTSLAEPVACAAGPVSPWNGLFILAVVGVRGVVSLAVALAIPLTAQNGTLFPYRDLILFVAFGVVATLVVQGLLLPSVVHWLGFLASHAADEHESEHKAELTARAEAPRAAQSRLELAADGDYFTQGSGVLGILLQTTSTPLWRQQN